MEQKKKPTNGQLLRRIERALIHVDRTKETQEIYFADKGLRLTVNEDVAIIATGFHRHVFNSFTNTGVSRPYLYVKRMIEIANTNDCKTDNGYAFSKLLHVLKEEKKDSDYNICVFVEWWIFNCFQPLYSIGETEAESFLVYESYIHNIARNAILLSEKTEDMTNKQYIEKVIENIKEYTKNLEERVIFRKKTDEELMQENIEAIQEHEANDAMEARQNAAE